MAEAGVESEFNVTELVVKVEALVNVVMIELGLETGEEVVALVAVFVPGVKDWVEDWVKAVVGTATG